MNSTRIAVTPGRFHGGLKLDGHRKLATGKPIASLPLSERYYLWLEQHHGPAALPCVAVGDRILGGQIVAAQEGRPGTAIHSPTSGIVADFQDLPAPTAQMSSAHMLVIESDGEDRACHEFGAITDWENAAPETLTERIAQSGIVGLGGAVFATGAKIGRAAANVTLILNGAECEPYISCDDGLMRERADSIITGARILLRALGSKDCLVAIERDKPEAIAAMETAIRDAGDERLRLERIFSLYPAGGERQLIEALTGRQVPRGGLPQDIGLVCLNVGTAAAVGRAVCRGQPLTSRITTVTGPALVAPGNFDVRIGTPIRELVAAAGGCNDPSARLIMGGPMMGVPLQDDRVPVVKAMNCLLVLPANELSDGQNQRPCIRCGDCAEVCPARLLPQQMYWELRDERFEPAREFGLDACIECGCCDVVCPSHLPLTQYFRWGKSQLHKQFIEHERAEHARQRFEARNARLEKQKAERQARLAAKREALEKARSDSGRRAAIDEIMARKKRAADENNEPGQSE